MQPQEMAPQPRLHLTEARGRRGWSQQELASQIGTTHVNVSRWERGITRPSPYFRRKLCAIYGKSEQELDLTLQNELTASPPATALVREADGRESVFTPFIDPAIPLPSAIRLVGRDDELAQIKQRLYQGGNVALTALNGLPGVGKTTLAITLAHDPEVRARFRDGVLWAGLGPTPNLPGLLSRWGTLLGISPTEMASLNGSEAWGTALRAAIGSRRMLLVIDDAWEIEEALTFRVGGPNCAHMLTTRFPAIAMHVAGGGATVLHELNEDESMTLLGALAPTVVSREAQRAHDLVHAVGGLPLALTLIGKYLHMQAYSGQSRRITQALERLNDAEVRLQVSEPRAPVERHPSLPVDASLSLQSVIAVTDQLLDEPARQTLYALSVFPPKPNSFSEEAALAVTGLSVDALDTIIDAGLLEGSGTDRYTLHQVIADYARVHLKRNSPHERYARLIVYMIACIEDHKKDYELLDLESNNIHAALELAYDLGREAELVQGVCAFAPFLLLRGLYAQAEGYLKQAHEVALALDDKRGLINTLLYLGETSQKQGNYAQAEASYQEGLMLARQLADNERVSALLNNLGWVSLKRGEYSQAETYLQEGLSLARQINHMERLSSLLEMMGSVAGTKGEFAQSEEYLLEGLTLARQIGDRERICSILINLGITEAIQGNDSQAEIYMQEGLLLARQIKHHEWISFLLINLGNIAVEQTKYTQAEEYLQEGLILTRQLGHREGISVLLINLGLTSRKQGHYAQSQKYLQEALSISEQIHISQITANALYELGNLYLDQNKLEEAKSTFNIMLSIVPSGDQELLALAQYGLGRVAMAQDNINEARNLGEASIITLEAIGHRKAQEVRYWLNDFMEEI